MHPRQMSDRELRVHNDRVQEKRERWAREHGYNSWAEYIRETEEGDERDRR